MGSGFSSHVSILLCPRLGWKADQHPRLQRRCAADLSSTCITRSKEHTYVLHRNARR